MEKLKAKETFVIFTPHEGKLPAPLTDLPNYLRKLLIWIEKFYSQIAGRVNWQLTNVVLDHTADYTLTEAESGSTHSNLGATGTVTVTLEAATQAGIKFTFTVQAAQELRIDPGEATIRDDSGQTAGKYKTANAIGECLQIISDSNGDWYTIAKYGTWTEEA